LYEDVNQVTMVEKLDDLQGYAGWDRLDMLHLMDSFIGQIEEAIGYKVGPLSGVSNICLCGIGGSAMCGDVLIDYLTPICDKQITVVRSVTLPKWVNASTLIVVISYSGNTKEALDIFQDSSAKGMKTVCITSGGDLLKWAKEKKVPFIQVPPGIQPRAALGYLLGSAAVILDAAGACSPVTALREVLPFARSAREKMIPSSPTAVNPAKKIALALEKQVPAVYAPRSVRSVAVRWANQINENAKMVAFSGEIPEMNHNQMVGWLGGYRGCKCRPVFIIPGAMEPTVEKMAMVTIQMFNERGMEPVLVQLEGSTPMQNLIYGLILGDLVSYYLARLRDLDPTPVDVIGEFKRRIGP
jgi:glucose/mannose-6-phosphate isomerase